MHMLHMHMCIPIVSKITRPGIQKNVAVFGVSKSIQEVFKTQCLPQKRQITLKISQKISKRTQKYRGISKTIGIRMLIQKYPKVSKHIYEHVANTSILGTAC